MFGLKNEENRIRHIEHTEGELFDLICGYLIYNKKIKKKKQVNLIEILYTKKSDQDVILAHINREEIPLFIDQHDIMLYKLQMKLDK